MSRGVKIYALVLLVIALGALLWWWMSLDPRVSRLNERLAADPVVAAYPYRFRVLRIEGTTAVLATPRTPEVPAMRFLATLDPRLAHRQQDDPALMAAQQALVRVHKRVKKLVLEAPGIERVRWELDRDWWTAHGVANPTG